METQVTHEEKRLFADEENIFNFVNTVRVASEVMTNKAIDADVLYDIVTKNDVMLRKLCRASIQTYKNINRTRELLG